MKVYYRGRSVDHHMHIQPSHDEPHVNAWREPDGRAKSFHIHFINNVADVDDNLGQYMIDKGLASKSRIISSLSEVA